jgi:CRISPR-associated exonuclease Cas4
MKRAWVNAPTAIPHEPAAKNIIAIYNILFLIMVLNEPCSIKTSSKSIYLKSDTYSTMLGESTLKDSIVKAVDELVNIKKYDNDTIYIEEVTTCLRRSYYNRKEERVPLKERFKIFNESMKYNAKSGIREYGEEGLGFKIITKADMVVDDAIIHFNIVDDLPNTPYPKDLMALNANLWIFNKEEGALVYITKDGNNIQFSLRRDKRLFDETKRRATVLHTLLKEGRVPILEPSEECISCSYYEKCYVQHKRYDNPTLEKIFGFKRD